MRAITNIQFACCVSIAFSALSLFMVFHHELWMDEAYHYLLARDSGSVTDLFKNGTQSGHPVIWNVCLYYYNYLFPGVLAMQLLHCALACVCVFLINRYAPFDKTEKMLISFGYFFIYEYNVIAKNYILGFCLIFAALVLYDRKKSFLLITFLLGFACNLHLFTLFVSVTLFGCMGLSRWRSEKKIVLAGACMVMAAAILCGLIQIIPSAQHISEYKSYDVPSYVSMERAGRSLSAVCRGLLNVPDFRQHSYWNSNFLYEISHPLAYLISLFFVVIIYISFKNSRPVLYLFFIPTGLIAGFVYMMPLSTGIRYWGYFYVLLMICFWIYKKQHVPFGYSRLFFKSVLFLQVLVAVPALWIEVEKPFSNAKYAALSLGKSDFLKYPLFVQSLGLGPSISAYADRKVYYPSSKTFESYSYYISTKKYSVTEFIAESISDLKNMTLDTCVLVMKEPVSGEQFLAGSADPLLSDFKLKKIALYDGAIVTSENYYLYLLYR